MADLAAARGLRRGGARRGRRSHRPQHLPYPRKRVGKNLFRTRQAARAQGGRAEARPARRRSSSPAASPRPRAPKSCAASRAVDVVVGPQSYHRLPELLREARARPGVIDTDFPAEDNSTICRRAAPDAIARSAASPPSSPSRRAATSSAPSASCPIRAARKSRARSRRSSRRSRRLARAGVREVTLIGQNVNAYHGRRRGGPPVGLAGLIARGRRAFRARAACATRRAIPNDMSDDLIAAHRRCRGAGALSASAGPVGLRPHPGGDEPPPSRARLSRHRRAGARRRGRTSRSRRTSSSAFPARRDADFEETLALVRAVGFASSFAFKYSARPGTPAAEMDGPDRRGRQGGAPGACRRCSRSQRQAFNRALRRAALRCPVREAGPPRRPVDRPLALYAGGVRRGDRRR